MSEITIDKITYCLYLFIGAKKVRGGRMSVSLDNMVVIAISSRALFDLDESDKI